MNHQFQNSSVTKSDKLRKRLLESVLATRMLDIYNVKGNDRGREACHQILVDCNKRQQFLEQCATSSIDVAEFGKLLGSAFGREIPQSLASRLEQSQENLFEKLVCVKLQKEGCVHIYYVVPNIAGENDFTTASTEEEIRHIGRILYSTRDEDPAESFCDTIIQVYLGAAEHNSTRSNELFDSVRKGELQRVATYLEEGGDVNSADEYGRRLIHHAAHSGNMDVIRFLKDKGANVHAEDNMCGRKPVHIAAKEGHFGVVSFFLLEVGASPNECDKINWTPLHYAVWKGDLNTIWFLIEHGADINAKEVCRAKKPIHIAAEHGYTDVIKCLISKRANIEDGDLEGRTPLYYSVIQGQHESFHFLISEGADKNTKNRRENTLLHVASCKDNKEIIEFLLNAGLDFDKKDSIGWTPLHYAARFDSLNMLQVLVDRGADLFAVDDDGKKPLDVCKKHADMVLHIVYRMCQKLQEEGKYKDALELYNENFEIIKTLRQDIPEYLEIRNKIGVMFHEMGHHDAAAAIFKDVLVNRERCLGSSHFETLCTKHGLALVYDAQLRHSEAMGILEEVLEKRKAILGDDHEDTLNVSRDLGHVQFKKGEYDEAFKMFEHVFEKRYKYFGSDHLKTLQARQDMAVIFVNKGEFVKALQIFKEVLEKRTTILGNNHPDTFITSCHVELTSEKIENNSQVQHCSIS